MNRIYIAMVRVFASFERVKPANGVAAQLLERAQACAGRRPQEALELRRAARVYLSVVR